MVGGDVASVANEVATGQREKKLQRPGAQSLLKTAISVLQESQEYDEEGQPSSLKWRNGFGWIWCYTWVGPLPGTFIDSVGSKWPKSLGPWPSQGQQRGGFFDFRDGNPGKEIHQQSASVKEMSVDNALRRRDTSGGLCRSHGIMTFMRYFI